MSCIPFLDIDFRDPWFTRFGLGEY
jgi:hypothetical protein